MGNGVVLEEGTHNELLQDENGPYSRLVIAQKLREKHDDLTDTESVDKGVEDMEKKAREEVPSGRRDSAPSLASDIIEQKRQEARDDDNDNDDHSLPYLFKRMSQLNRDGWSDYMFGFVAAVCELFYGFAFHRVI